VLLAGLVLPRAETARIVAALGVTAYLIALLAEMTGLVPSSIPAFPQIWHVPLLYAVIMILGAASIALAVTRYIAAAEQQQESLTRLLGKNRRELVWGAVGKRVIGAQNLDQVLTVLMQAINQEINVESGSVLLREWDSHQLVFAKILRGQAQHFSSLRLRVGQGIAGWVAQTGQSVIIEDAAQDPRWYSGVDRVTGFTTRSILCVPLIAEVETIGVIELLNKFDGAFTTNDRELLEAIATQVAPTIQNKRLQEQMRSAQFPSNELFRQIEHAKQEWEETVDAIDEGIALVDENCRILRANRILASWIDAAPAQLIGRQCFEVLHGNTTMPPTCPHARLLATGIPAEGEVESTVLGKTLRLKAYPIQDETGSRIGSVNVWRDITSEKRLREQLIQSEKMAATGRLVASIAHEINNPLQAVRGCVDLAQSTGDLEKNKRYLGMASTELERLTAIVRRMLDFYRPARAERAPLDLRALIEDVLLLSAKRLQHAHITVHTKWGDEIPTTEGVADQLKQVFLNFILNAVEAMPLGGSVEIRGQVIHDEGAWVTVSIADSGTGVAPQDLDKIFEPFYTTKSSGTGLGLTVCHNLITNHGGRVTVDSAPGHGSTFTIWLPVQEKP
jgi:signal transduction histidine kinase